jgi:hypothetical protein
MPIALYPFATNRASADDACPDASQDIATDRPSVTNSSLVVPTGSLQDENGINWTTRPEGQGALDGPNTRLRLGIAHCTEFLVDMPDYNRGIRGSAPDGFSDIAPAFKYQFEALPRARRLRRLSVWGCRPARTGLAGQAFTPTSSSHGHRRSRKAGTPTAWFRHIGSPISQRATRRYRRPLISIDRSARMPMSSPNMPASSRRTAYQPKYSILAGHIE